MRLTIEDLKAITETLVKIREVNLRVKEFQLGQHTITLEWVSDQKDGDYFVVTNIGNTMEKKNHPVMRSSD